MILSPWVAIRSRIQTNRELREELALVTEQRDSLAADLERIWGLYSSLLSKVDPWRGRG